MVSEFPFGRRADKQTFIALATALRDVGQVYVAAADKRDAKAVMDAGEALFQACESCHMKFWYPGQKIPAFPDEAPEHP